MAITSIKIHPTIGIARLVFFVFAVVGCAPHQTATQALGTYSNPRYHWSISYPGAWAVDASNPDFVKLTDPQNQALAGVHSGIVSGGDLNAHFSRLLDGMNKKFLSKGQFMSIVRQPRTRLISGFPAREVVFDIAGFRPPFGKSQVVSVLVGSRFISLNMETYLDKWGSYENLFEEIVQSLTVKP